MNANLGWEALFWIAPTLVLAAHCAVFGTWIVDDAAISFAYARHLATGNGLVPYPGAAPVEGFSNPLWVFLLSALHIAGLFTSIWTPKVISLVCVAGAFAAIERCLRREDAILRWAALLASTLVASQTAVAAWIASGLENGLYLLLLSVLFGSCVYARAPKAPFNAAIVAGVCAAAVALTRPEGVIYSAIFPGVIGVTAINRRMGNSALRMSAIYVATSGLLIGAYIVFRRFYFDDYLPNTFYAKGGPRVEWLVALVHLRPWWVSRLAELTRSMTGGHPVGWSLVLAVSAVVQRHYRATTWTAIAFLQVAVLGYLLLPADWMPEFRFATPVYLFAYLALSLSLVGLVSQLPPARTFAALALAPFLVAATMGLSVSRSLEFRDNPPISVAEVLATGDRFVQFAEWMNVKNPSILHADVGGLLLGGRLRVYDLGMLCDRRIAQYLGEGSSRRDLRAFHDYVFDEARPSFIATRAYHSWIANLQSDPRFRRDYEPIVEYEDQWIAQRYGESRLSGDYVRRELTTPAVLQRMRLASAHVRYAGCSDCSDARLLKAQNDIQ